MIPGFTSNLFTIVYRQRYSELKSLNEALENQALKVKLPVFPQRKIFGITNENPGIDNLH